MWDAWLGDALLLLAIPAYLISGIVRIRPRMLPGDGMRLVDVETLQAEYRRRYPIRLLLLRILPAILATYFIVRIILWPPGENAGGPSLVGMVLAGFAVFVATLAFTTILRIVQEPEFVCAHPEFSDCLLPIRPRVLAVLPLVLTVGDIVAAIAVEIGPVKFALLGLGIIGLVIRWRLRYRQWTHSRHELSWDEPLGQRISDVIEKFGLTPKKLVLIPSLITNAFALPDGSVVVMSALRTVATPAEVAAVVAHELSHVRDREGKKLDRLKRVSLLPVGLLAGVGVGFGQGAPLEALMPSVIYFGAMALSIPTTWWFCRRTRPIEFKCDRDAANLGLGAELASCLDKIARFMGQPGHWIGIDRLLITHPSLEERVAELQQIVSERKLSAIQVASEHSFPTADIEEMNREIEEGYQSGLP